MSLRVESDPVQEPLIQEVRMERGEAIGQLDAPDQLIGQGEEAAQAAPSRSLLDHIKYGFLNLCGRIYRAFSSCPSLDEACKQGNIWLVRGFAFMENLPQATMQAAIAAASEAGKWKIVQYFAECFGYFYVNDENLTPLHRLIYHGMNEETLALIAMLPDEALQVDYQGYTPLRAAASKGQIEVTKALIQRDEKAARALFFELIDNPKSTAKEIETLLKAGIGANLIDTDGSTALGRAIENNRIDLVRILLQEGADANLASANIVPIGLVFKCGQNSLEMLKALHAHGADLTKLGPFDQPMIHLAALAQNLPVAEYLLDQGVDVNTVDKSGKTPLVVAMMRGASNLDLVKLLLDKGAKNIADSMGTTPLMVAYEYEMPPSVCHRLIEKSDAFTVQELQPVFEQMVKKKDYQGLDLLIEKGVDIAPLIEGLDAEDIDFNDFVFNAYQRNHGAIVHRFISQGKGLGAQDAQGHNLMHMVAEHGDHQLITLLSERGVSATDRSYYDDRTPFRIALETGHITTAIELAKKGGAKLGDLKVLDDEKYHQFVLGAVDSFGAQQFIKGALARGDLALIDFLMSKGARPLKPETPFLLALEQRNIPFAVKFARPEFVNRDTLSGLNNQEFRSFVVGVVNAGTLTAQQFLNSAIFRKDLKLVNFLILKGADPIVVSGKSERNSFHLAALQDPSGEMVRYLGAKLYEKRKSADFIFMVDGQGNTALHLASFNGHTQSAAAVLGILQFHMKKMQVPLEQMHSYVNALNLNGDTALHLAAGRHHQETGQFLIAVGANKKVKNKQGKAPEPLLASAKGFLKFAGDVLKEMVHLN